ncbi:glucose-1-phosphate adenylyltransferase [Planctomycetales bacterium]|nr:glucose-1-phosphate adenylyltransferase [Planctomycetales bacterium]GHT00659.1 glucose-1-phosphate adenylyltransferase [Planctomycetales bacterium]GHT07872.1 glucose-1-phosphate adenylyltransferase [Planctomycetales bacterium]GHV21574.1 glucose-1-phosphate adenylyltransferase [Planctomycetales bacterium]
MKNTIAVILGGGQGNRLFPLTKERSKPAVPIAGKYRLIDVPISNCINSGIMRIYVLTMYQSASLNQHISKAYRFDSFSHGFVDILAAEQTRGGGTWFQGTADAVRQSWAHITDRGSPDSRILILSGDHLYKMNYREFAKVHADAKADFSIAVQPVTRKEAPELGLLKTDASGRIVQFAEKPKTAEELDAMTVDTTVFGLTAEQAKERPFLASMGIYLGERAVMSAMLGNDTSKTDFGKHLIPQAIKDRHVQAYCFNDYWADIGTIGAFYDANIDLVNPLPKFNLFDRDAPLYTHQRYLPGAKLNRGSVECSLLSDGAIIEDALVRNSVVGLRQIVRTGAVIESSVLMGADYYQLDRQDGKPSIGIGKDAHLRRTIVDKNASIGNGVQLVNNNGVNHYDDPEERFFVRDGITIVVKNAVIPDGLVF